MIHDSYSSYSVKNLEETARFYRQILGLQVEETPMGILEVRPPGSNKLWLYPKEDHQPATYTVINLLVENIDKEVDRLYNLGVGFERYDEFEADEKGIVRMEDGPVIAWFKDPSENVIALIEEPPSA